MLILERRPGSSIRIGDDVTVTVKQIRRNNAVKIGIRAPRDTPVIREELIHSDYEQTLASKRLRIAENSAKAAAAHSKDPFQILVIENEPAHARVIELALTDGGYTDLTWCDRGMSALDLLKRESVDQREFPRLVLLDSHLPDVGGVELIRSMRHTAAGADLPIVVLSATGASRCVRECLGAGANAFVEKSSSAFEFEESVRTIADYWAHQQMVS